MKRYAIAIFACLLPFAGLCQHKYVTDPAYLDAKAKEQQNKSYFPNPNGEYITAYPAVVPRKRLDTKAFQDSVRSYLIKEIVVSAKAAQCSRIAVHFRVENVKKKKVRIYELWNLEE
jgi:hypothetical protein